MNNPYKVEAGAELDQLLHDKLFSRDPTAGERALRYSTDEQESDKVKVRLERIFRKPIVVGLTSGRIPRHFARLESDPSTSTEALAETRALAICRLAAVLLERHF